jgi:predicted nucleotidyltransferase
MGILIQEVVGSRIGKYFLPGYSGVARSRNEFRWSEEIDPDDGLIRLMPGLGGCVSENGYREPPVLVIPGRPALKVDSTHGNGTHNGPKTVNAIDLESNCVRSVDFCRLLSDFEYPLDQAAQIVSVLDGGDIRPLDPERRDYDDSQLVVDFDGLISRSPFIIQIRNALRTLERALGSPVEVEFASDGEHLYILQCRSRGFLPPPRPAPIPKDIDETQVVFATNRLVPNGCIREITHVVYVNPEELKAHGSDTRRGDLEAALQRLNELLPKRQFIVVSPFCAGVDSEDGTVDGVDRTIFTNTALLADLIKTGSIEGAGSSQGVHCLLDLMESGIHYLPVYLEEQGTTLNETFLTRSESVLPELVPEYAFLADAVRVIDVVAAMRGQAIHVLMNAELSEAVALLVDPGEQTDEFELLDTFEDGHPENYWRWRYRMAEQIASHLDPDRFGVSGFYLIGSTKNGTAGPASDIDVLVHFVGTEAERESLLQWLEGWSLCLDEMNYLRTGYRSRGLLDVHLVTDEDIEKRTSYAVKINAVTDAARPLEIKDSGNPDSSA